MKPRILNSAHEIARYLRCSYPTCLRMIREEGLPAARFGKNWRTSTALIDQWIIAKHVLSVAETKAMRDIRIAKKAARQRLAALEDEPD